MDFQVAAKSTKPSSKQTVRLYGEGRVPVGTLHFVDVDAQDHSGSMYDALCGERHLVAVDVDWHGKAPNERCESCTDAQWQASFAEEQRRLLK